MEYTIHTDLQALDPAPWKRFVVDHPDGNPFQLPAMFAFYDQVPGYDPVAVLAREDDDVCGVILGVIQQEHAGLVGKFSARTIVWGGPLVRSDHDTPDLLADGLLKNLVKAVRKRSIYIELRNLFDTSAIRRIAEAHGFTYHEHLNFQVRTEPEEALRKRISASKLRQVRKAMKAGVKIIEPENPEQVKAFYDILADLYRNRVKKPLPGWTFFEQFYDQRANHRLGLYLLLEFQGKIIGGILCPVMPGKVIYEWYVCGLDQAYKQQYPSVVATWAAIDYALRHGIGTFDFMGAGKPDQDYGVREFKSKFGGDMVQLGRYQRINKPLLMQIGKLGVRILGKLRSI